MILQPAVPVSQVDSDLVWFPVRITSVLGGGAYTFQEVWITPTSTIQDKTGGRYNGTLDKAYAIDGSTFAATAAGSAVQVFARRAMGVGGVGWELKGFGGVSNAGCGGFIISGPGGFGNSILNPLFGQLRAEVSSAGINFYDSLSSSSKGYDTNSVDFLFGFSGSLTVAAAGNYYVGFAVWPGTKLTTPPTGIVDVYDGIELLSLPSAGTYYVSTSAALYLQEPYAYRPLVVSAAATPGTLLITNSFTASWGGQETYP